MVNYATAVIYQAMASALTFLTGSAILTVALAANGLEVLGPSGLLGGNTVQNPSGTISGIGSGSTSVLTIGDNPTGGNSIISVLPGQNIGGGISAVNLGTDSNGVHIGLLDVGSVPKVPSGMPSSITGPQFLSVLEDDWLKATQPSGQNVLLVPNVKFGSRAHGADLAVENNKWGVLRQGFASTVRPNGDSLTGWVHFAIPTPAIVDNNRLRLGAAYLKFSTGKDASIKNILIADGGGPPSNENHDGYSLTGPKQVSFFTYNNNGPSVFWAVSIALFIEFKNQESDAWVQLVSAGIDFV